MTYGDTSFLIYGDGEEAGEQAMIASGEELSSDVASVLSIDSVIFSVIFSVVFPVGFSFVSSDKSRHPEKTEQKI